MRKRHPTFFINFAMVNHFPRLNEEGGRNFIVLSSVHQRLNVSKAITYELSSIFAVLSLGNGTNRNVHMDVDIFVIAASLPATVDERKQGAPECSPWE